MTWKIYVAGAYAARADVSRYLARLWGIGAEITLDWPAVIAAAGKPDSELTAEERQHYAEMDLVAVEQADIVWLMIPVADSKGSWVKFGYAIAWARWTARLNAVAAKFRPDAPPLRQPRIIIASGDQRACIFGSARGVLTYDTHADAFSAISALVVRGGTP